MYLPPLYLPSSAAELTDESILEFDQIFHVRNVLIYTLYLSITVHLQNRCQLLLVLIALIDLYLRLYSLSYHHSTYKTEANSS